MTTALLDYALLTVAEATASLRSGVETDVEDLVNRTTDYCEWYCNRPLAARAFEDLRFPAQANPVLRMRATPIDVSGGEDAPLTIAVAGIAQTVWTKEADGEPEDFDVIVGADADVPGEPNHFWRACGWSAGSSRNPYPILITYTGGIAPIPGQLREAARLVLENIFRAQEHKLSEVSSFTQGPIAPGVVFRPELIPMKAKQILDSYRVWG